MQKPPLIKTMKRLSPFQGNLLSYNLSLVTSIAKTQTGKDYFKENRKGIIPPPQKKIDSKHFLRENQTSF